MVQRYEVILKRMRQEYLLIMQGGFIGKFRLAGTLGVEVS